MMKERAHQNEAMTKNRLGLYRCPNGKEAKEQPWAGSVLVSTRLLARVLVVWRGGEIRVELS